MQLKDHILLLLLPVLILSVPFLDAESSERGPDPVSEAVIAGLAPDHGDVIELKSGRKLEGLYVVRTTLTEYVVSVYEGVTIRIPRSQVASVEYDTRHPANVGEEEDGEVGVLPGARISRELNAQLTQPIFHESRRYESADLLDIVEELREETDVRLKVASEVEDALSREEREWTIRLDEDTTLLGLLRGPFSERFPQLVVNYEYDEAVITTREAQAEAE